MEPSSETYVDRSLLHRSATTVVERATRVRDGQRVVLKSSNKPSAYAVHTARYEREFEIARRFESDHVVRCLNLEFDANKPVLVFQDSAGFVCLRDALNGTPWAMETLFAVSIRLTEAVGTVHAQSVVHRDVNPNNFLIHPMSLAIKIIDFGLASTFATEEQALRSPGSLEGTLSYLSPEQTGRANRTIDYRSDFYSLGVTLYELATGQLPFAAADSMDLVYAHLARAPVSPQHHRPELPDAFCQIVLKLLAKSGEDRYQSAQGLKRDLEDALAEASTPTGAVFVPGRYDRRRSFRLPERLYGRETETRALVEALELATHGRPQLLLVDGASGAGKTSVIQETYPPLTRQRGYFIRGKFEQFKRDTPFSALTQAFRDLVRQWLTESETELANWKETIVRIVGANGAILTAVIPELQWLLGPQPPAPDLSPAETQNRFHHVFQNFFGACARSEHPLVLFLDDLQWADNASFDLLRVVLAQNDDRPLALLVVGAYRTHEVDANHPLVSFEQWLRQAAVPVHSVAIAPLRLDHTVQLLQDTLSCSAEACLDLARLVWDRTQGNPFFLHQLLRLAHKSGGLSFDDVRDGWRWDVNAIRDLPATGNVLDLLLERLRQLSLSLQFALGVAACMGTQFHLGEFAAVLGGTRHEASSALSIALHEGLLLSSEESGPARDRDDGGEGNVVYRFMHDRVQQAAYLLIEEGQRSTVHLQIGRRRLAHATPVGLDEQLFSIVDHFTFAEPLLTTAQERATVARLFYRAGVKAKQATAYKPALRYLQSAAQLLAPNSWQTDYEFTLNVYRNLTECAYLGGETALSERLSESSIRNTRTELDTVPFFIIQIQRYAEQQNLSDSIRVGIDALRRLGVSLPENPSELGVVWQLFRIQWALALKSRRALETAPALHDAKAIACIRILVTLLSPAYRTGRIFLFAVASFQILRISIRYGYVPETSGGFGGYALILYKLGFFRRAKLIEDICMTISRRFSDGYQKCMEQYARGAHAHHWHSPVREGLALLEESVKLGLEFGNPQYVGISLATIALFHQCLGTPLVQLNKVVKRAIAFAVRYPDLGMMNSSLSIELMHDLATTTDTDTLAVLNERLRDFLFDSVSTSVGPGAHQAMFLHIIFGSAESAAVLLARSDKYFDQYYMSNFGRAAHTMHHSILAGEICDTATGYQRFKHRRRLRRNRRQLEIWVDQCAANFRHYLFLVQAEEARVDRHIERALQFYNAAIKAARVGEFTQDEAIANERAARLCRATNRDNFARMYTIDAHDAYNRWGAVRKVQLLESEFPEWLGDKRLPAFSAERRASKDDSSQTVTISSPNTQFDVISVIKSSQALAAERVLDTLLAKLMDIVLRNAGAQRGFLILSRKGDLQVEAMFNAESITVGPPRPLADCPDLAATVVHYVARTQVPVVLDDARIESRFQNDPYIERGEVLSLLCIAMTHRGQVAGVLYLENNSMAGAFPSARVTFLDLIASQTAVSIENAILYSEITAANQHLEVQIAERTVELRTALADLWGEMDLARKIQTVLLPPDGIHEGCEIQAIMKPADSVGGDYYDIVPTEGAHWVLIGDVSGHGVSAGLIMMMVQATARALILNQLSITPSKLLCDINRTVYENLRKIGTGDYMTLQAFCIRGASVTYSGQHQDVVVYRAATQSVEHRTDMQGTWIGLLADLEGTFVDESLTLDAGDVLLLYTDGITEARLHGRMMDMDGLKELLLEEATRVGTNDSLVERIFHASREYEVNDDITLMSVRRLLPP